MKKLIYILIAISITCFSCTKKSDESGTPQSGLCRLSSHSTFMGTETYFYDTQNRITVILYVEDSDSTWEYYYYESDHVKYRTLYYSDMQEDSVWFHYSSGKYTDAVSEQDSVHFTYNGSGQIARQDQYVAGDLATYTEYAYDAHGNCISEITWANSYSGPERAMWHEIEYGSSRNYYAVKLPPVDTYEAYWWMMTGPDNIMKFRVHYPDSDPQTLIWEYSGFNGNGYPVNYSIKDSAEGNIGVEIADYVCP